MTTGHVDDARAFRTFLEAKLIGGEPAPSLDECLALWVYENATDDEREDTLAAIRRGLADVEAGRVVPAREAIADLRRRHNLPPLP